MSKNERARAGLMASLGLAIPVVTTGIYVAAFFEVSDEAFYSEAWSSVVSVWLTEIVGFAIGMIAALGLASERGSEKASWNALAMGALFGILSTAIGIGLFKGFGTAGDEFEALANAIVTFSFFFYFLSKALIGAGVVGIGIALVQGGTALGRILGLVAGLTGLAAAVVNTAGMATGLELIMPGGATGVAAGLVGAIAVFVLTRSAPSENDH